MNTGRTRRRNAPLLDPSSIPLHSGNAFKNNNNSSRPRVANKRSPVIVIIVASLLLLLLVAVSFRTETTQRKSLIRGKDSLNIDKFKVEHNNKVGKIAESVSADDDVGDKNDRDDDENDDDDDDDDDDKGSEDGEHSSNDDDYETTKTEEKVSEVEKDDDTKYRSSGEEGWGPRTTGSSEWWKKGSTNDLWYQFDCERIFKSPRDVHSQDTWMKLRKEYEAVVGTKKSTVHIGPNDDDGERGVKVPYMAKQTAVKGRGIFAGKGVIQKETLVWTARSQSARFEKGDDYREFVSRIPRSIACDVLQWAYVESFAGKKNSPLWKKSARICVDLDEGSFMNGGGWTDEEDSNVGCNKEKAKEIPGGCKENLFALRDIKEGEEFLVSYGSFAISDGWKWFGL